MESQLLINHPLVCHIIAGDLSSNNMGVYDLPLRDGQHVFICRAQLFLVFVVNDGSQGSNHG